MPEKCEVVCDHIEHACTRPAEPGRRACEHCRRRVVNAMHAALWGDLADEVDEAYAAEYGEAW